MRKIFILFAYLLIGQSLKSQNLPFESAFKVNSTIVDNDLYKGRTTVKIPLYNIEVGGINLIGEIYNSESGFNRAYNSESIYGQNWSGNLLGQIVRATNHDFMLTQFISDNILSNNIPDKSYYTTDCIKTNSNLSYQNSKKNLLINPLNNGVAKTKSNFNPDYFFFDFFGYKGYFTFDNQGKLLVNSESGNFQISITGNKCYSTRAPIDPVEILIVDDKGNRFFFGGTYDSSEVDYNEFTTSGPSSLDPYFTNTTSLRTNHIITWNLTKIEFYNGEKISAKYVAGNKDVFNSYLSRPEYVTGIGDQSPRPFFPSSSELSLANIFMSKKSYVKQGFVSINTHTYTTLLVNNHEFKRSLLEEIIFLTNPEKNIKFTYSVDDKRQPSLTSIVVTDFGKKKNIDLFQNKSNIGNHKMSFLNAIFIGVDKYFFQYYNLDNAAYIPTKPAINEYGYYQDSTSPFEMFNTSLLRKITYPSQGYTIFNYEKGDYSKNYTFKDNDGRQDYHVLVNEENNLQSVARLSSKIDFDGNNSYETKYFYKLNDGKSSGIKETYKQKPEEYAYQVSPNGNEYSTINYSQIQEVVNNNGSKEYFYNNRESNPDLLSGKFFGGNPNYFGAVLSKNQERGKLSKMVFYDLNKTPKKLYEYKYFNLNRPENELVDFTDDAQCITCKLSDKNYFVFTKATQWNYIASPPTGLFTMYVPVMPYLLSEEKITEFLGNSTLMESKKTYNYNTSAINWHPHIIEQKTEIGNKINVEKIYYPGDIIRRNPSCITGNCPFDSDLVGEKFSIYKTMVNDNINYPIITTLTNTNNKTSIIENVYKKNFSSNNFLKLDRIRVSLLDSNFSAENYNVAKVYDKALFEFYDNKANLLQSNSDNFITTTTIWGYNQTLPIAKIEGATYAQVMEAFNLDGTDLNSYLELDIVKKSNFDKDEESENNFIASLDIFRKKLFSYQVTTYAYDPLIGIKNITPRSGIQESFVYDSSNRLEKILDANNYILKEFKYNIHIQKFYNEAKSQSFIKNDCPIGKGGNYVTYHVPANKYYSYFNQDDANQQAQNEINQNGQINANNQGTCNYANCEVIRPYYFTQSDYMSFLPDSPSHVNVILSLAYVNPASINTTWSNGVFIGTVASYCRPNSITTINNVVSGNRIWKIIINQAGDITISLVSGSPPALHDRINLSFSYNK